MEESDYEAELRWLCQEGYYNAMTKRAKEACMTFPENENLQLTAAVALALTNRTNDCIDLASRLIEKEDSSLAALLIQSIACRISGTKDRINISHIDGKIRDERRKASAISLARASNILLNFKKIDKAKEYADRAYKNDSNDKKILLIVGWIYLYQSREDKKLLEKARDLFSFISKNNDELGYVLGLAKIEELKGFHDEAITILNRLIVRYKKLILPLTEKMLNQFAIKDWEQTIDTADRIISIDSNSIDALKAKSVVALCRDGLRGSGLKNVQNLFKNLFIAEPNNVDLMIDNIQLFTRITNRDALLIGELIKITDKTMEQNNNIAGPMVELGNLSVLIGKLTEAEHWYRCALRIDESSFCALTGLANCQILESAPNSTSIELARQQLDFLMELESKSRDPRLLLMSAKINANEPIKALENLGRAVETIIEITSRKNNPYGYKYLNDLNPSLCLEIVQEYLVHSPCRLARTYINNSSSFNDIVDNENENDRERHLIVCELLEKVVDACPGMEAALVMLAKVRMQAGHLDEAVTTLKKLLDNVDPSNPAGHLLTAQILTQQGQYDSAAQTLEVGLSFNFRVRDDPIYHFITAIIEKERGNLEACINSLRVALTLVDNAENDIATPISTSDKATLYLELISVYGKLKKFDQAATIVEEAKILFARTTEEARVLIANAELHLEMGDIDRAIKCLIGITPGKPYYVEARTTLARIYLEQRKDRHAFAKCFRELVEHSPGPRSYSMLGDAYISIQEPDRAIEAYEQSLVKNPFDKILAEKMGKALIKTHQYEKAINYYKDVVKNKACADLKLDLADLYMRVKQYDKAENTLVQELQDARGLSDLPSLERRVRQLLLLAKIRERAGNVKSALSTLKDAKDSQVRCIQRFTIDQSAITQKQLLADIFLDMAEYASSLGDYHQAIGHYKEALSYKPTDVKSLLSLTKLYMQVNDLDRCRQSCSALLNADPNNEAASVIMADLAFRKVDFETAAFHFRQLLLRRPTYWTALARLIEVSRRTGNISDLDEWLSRAASAMDPTNREAGYYYCSGLLNWRTGKLNAALGNFNSARRDPEWGQQAIYNMIEICLDPDDDATLSSEALNDADAEYQDSRTMALNTAKRLLQELSPKGNAHEMLTHRLLGDFFLLATKQKSNIERALQDCTNLASQESLREHVGPALGLAMAHILLKQTPRARNHLKRVCKNVWTFEDAEYLERCWLLLADIYVQSSKYDLANELLKRVLQHNATCVRAHELSGHIAEKEQNYREASIRYSQAWKYGGKTNLSVGYKLAYCSSKCKNYADAIRVCNQVLSQNPDFPRIRKDILEKSINNIRS